MNRTKRLTSIKSIEELEFTNQLWGKAGNSNSSCVHPDLADPYTTCSPKLKDPFD